MNHMFTIWEFWRDLYFFDNMLSIESREAKESHEGFKVMKWNESENKSKSKSKVKREIV